MPAPTILTVRTVTGGAKNMPRTSGISLMEIVLASRLTWT